MFKSTYWGTGHICERVAIRGGNWDNGSNAGVFALNLNNPRSNSNHDISFRSAVLLVRSSKRNALEDSAQENGSVSLPN
ncbi:hypothetical protein ETC03_07025 [Geobacillus sp. MMMUD3]|nr:hypothetical protein [Geobacillus sp. MMMUD3]